MKIKKRKLNLKYGALTLLAVFGIVVLMCLAIEAVQILFMQNIPKYSPKLYGDLNHDGVVDYQDGDLMYETLIQNEENPEIELIDLNRDSVIDNEDTLYYYAYYQSEYFENISFEEFVNMMNRKEVVSDE